MASLIEKLLRTGDKKTLRQLRNYADSINALEDSFKTFTDAELREETIIRARMDGRSWFVENVRRAGEQVSEEVEEMSSDVEATQAQLAVVLAELRTISARLAALERDRHGATTSPDQDRSAPSARPSA